jgi:hypothetical protein
VGCVRQLVQKDRWPQDRRMGFGLVLLFSFPLVLAADLPPDASAREQREDVKTPVQSGQGRQIGTDLLPTKAKGHRIFMDDSEPAIVSEVVVQDDRTGRRMRMPIADFKLRYGFLPYDEKHCTGVLPDGQVFRCQIELSPQQAEEQLRANAASGGGTPKRKGKSAPLTMAAKNDPWEAWADRLEAEVAAIQAYERGIYQRVVEDERREEEAKKAIDKQADAEESRQERRKTWVLVGVGAAALVGLVLAVLLLLRLVRAFSFAIASGVDAARKRAKKD